VTIQREILHFNDEQSWLTARAIDVTSTESASLFGYGRETAFELACRKHGDTESRFKPNERTDTGKEIEDAIARRAARLFGVDIRHKNEYMRVHEWRMGASFDYEVTGVNDAQVDDNSLRIAFGVYGPGILEVKNVDSLVFKNEWLWNEEAQYYEAPNHIEIQLQHQLEISELGWGVIIAFVGGNRIEPIIRLRDEAVGAAIRKKVARFWKDLDAGTYPPVELPEDLDILKLLYRYAEPGKLLDARGNQTINDIISDYIAAAADEKKGKDLKDTAHGKLLQLIGDAEKVMSDVGTISCGMVAPTIVQTYERKGYRSWRVTPKKAQK
jgi:predicted phage-related endonuclease